MKPNEQKFEQKRLAVAASLAVAALLAAFPAAAQPSNANPAPSPFQGLTSDQNKDQPVQIEAATLEVRDKNKTATFSGNVSVVQGDTTMKCQRLVVFYSQEMGIAGKDKQASTTTAPVTTSKSTPGMPQGAQNIQKIEAQGGVTVLTKDQNARGDEAIYDLQTKQITLSGHVTISQGQNVIHGEKVVVDTVTGNARVESGSSNAGPGAGPPGPVRAVILPGGKGMMLAPNQPNSSQSNSSRPN
jgi:lipopolysaccharide export system protein LptA